MQMQPRLAEARAVAVDIVADDRPPLGCGMHAQLVGTAGNGFHGKPSEAVTPAKHLPVRNRRLSVGVRLLPPAAFRIEAAERQLDGALIRAGSTFHDRPIGLGNSAMLE